MVTKISCCTFWKRIISRRSLRWAGWYYSWLQDTFQTKHRKEKWEAVRSQLSLMPWLEGTWPYVEARRLSLLVSVILARIRLKPPDLIHLLILRLSVPLHMARCGWGAMEMLRLVCTFNLEIKARVFWRWRELASSERITRSEMTSITFLWWLINHELARQRFVCRKDRTLVSLNKGTLPLGRHPFWLWDISSDKRWITKTNHLAHLSSIDSRWKFPVSGTSSVISRM